MPDSLMDYLPMGVMLVTPDGTLQEANHAANRLLARGDAFRVNEGKLRLVDANFEEHFSAFRQGSGPERMLMRLLRRAAKREPQRGDRDLAHGQADFTRRNRAGRRLQFITHTVTDLLLEGRALTERKKADRARWGLFLVGPGFSLCTKGKRGKHDEESKQGNHVVGTYLIPRIPRGRTIRSPHA